MDSTSRRRFVSFCQFPPGRRCERILRPTFESGDVEEKMPTVLVVGMNEKQTCFPNDAQHRTGPTMFLMSQNSARLRLTLCFIRSIRTSRDRHFFSFGERGGGMLREIPCFFAGEAEEDVKAIDRSTLEVQDQQVENEPVRFNDERSELSSTNPCR